MTLPKTELTKVEAPAGLTFEEAMKKATELRPRLIAEQAATEARSYPSEDLHLTFANAGFYHLLRPKTFGGYEFTVPEFMAVMREIARGCMSTAWCLTLGSGHNLQVASWWPEEVQREVFETNHGYFAAAMVGAPGGKMRRASGGWVLNGTHKYSSGTPYATHFTGHEFIDTGAEGPPGPLSLFIARREDWEMLDDWGDTLGLKGSGSQSVRFVDALVPTDWVLEGQAQYAIDVTGGTPGLRMHGNPMYGAPGLGFFCNELAHLTIGAAWSALDEYEELMMTKTTIRPPVTLRVNDPDYQRWFALAYTKLAAAEAVAERASQLIMEFSQEAAEGGTPFSRERDIFVNQLSREGLTMAWKTVEDLLMQTVGSSATTNGTRMERIWRDLTMSWGHVNTIFRDLMARDYARERFAVGT
jgi:3-hydroxy-9,10-secoandrosta-1,3,5(10)-triene-9,17-dione monooxygenase